jgi:hypothetical protein
MSRHVQRTGLFIGSVLAAILFFLGGAALRLAIAPISLGPFAGAIEDSVNRSISGLVVRFDRAVLEWSQADRHLNLVILGAKVFDTNGRIVAQAPKADLDFDAAAMLAGDFSLKRFALIGVQLTAVRDQNGVLKLGFGAIQGDADLIKIIRDALEQSAHAGGSLQTFSIREARLAFRDEISGLFVVSPRINFALENRNDRLNAVVEAQVEISGAPAAVALRAELREDGTPQGGRLEVRGLNLAALASNSPKFRALAPYALTTNLAGDFVLGPRGEIFTATFRADGKGDVTPPFLKQPAHLDRLAAAGRYDRAAAHLVLDEFAIAGPEIEAKGKGDFRFAWRDEELATVTMGLTGQVAKVAPPGLFEAPVAFDQVAIQGAYEIGTRRLTAQRVALTGKGVAAAFSGTVLLAQDKSPAITATGQLQPFTVQDGLVYWPLIKATGARIWIKENLPEGRLGPMAVRADIPAGALDQGALPDSALSVSFPLEEVTAHYMRGLTPLTHARGTAQLSGDTFRMQVSSGNVGPLALSQGDVVIADLHIPHAPGVFKGRVEGRMPDVLTLVDMPPLGYATRFKLNPAETSGQALIDLDFVIPMRRDLKAEAVKIAVAGKIAGFAAPLGKRNIDASSVAFTIDNNRLNAEGAGRLSAVPIAFRWSEDFHAVGPTTAVDIQTRLDDASRASLGWSEPTWVTGIIPVTASFTGRRFDFEEAVLRADLTGTTATIPAIGFAKRPGTPGTATAKLHFGEQGAATISDIVVSGNGFAARGDMALSAAGQVVSANLTDIRAGENNDFGLAIEAAAPGQRNWRLSGRSLDARALVGGDEKRPAAAAAAPTAKPAVVETDESVFAKPINLDARLDKILLRDDLALRDAALTLNVGANERINGFALNAAGPGPRGKLTGRFAEANGARTMILESDAGGDFVRAFTGFRNVRNGRVNLKVNFGPEAQRANADYTATFLMNNFTVADQPFLARLFSSGSLDGPLHLLQGDGIAFSQIEAPFTSRGRVLTFRDGRASGAAIGFSFQGQIDRNKDTIDLNGSLVPVYGLNSMLGSVPILGNLLTSKEGEGIIAMTYRVRGDLDEPQVAVNPLSVLTPGIFRRIFEFGGPRQPPAAQNTPPASAQVQGPRPE